MFEGYVKDNYHTRLQNLQLAKIQRKPYLTYKFTMSMDHDIEVKETSNQFVLRFNVSVNDFSVMSGWSHNFFGFNRYSGELMCLVEGHNTEYSATIGDRTQDLPHALPLGHCAPHQIVLTTYIFIKK